MEDKSPDIKEVETTIDNSLDFFQTQQTLQLEKLQRLQEINNEALKREQERLRKKYGNDHPRVQKTEARLEYNLAMAEGSGMAISRSRMKSSPYDPLIWRIQGTVYDIKNKPVKDLTVFLINEEKKQVDEIQYCCTDESGNYSLAIDRRTVDTIENKPLFLSVSDKSRQLPVQDQDPLLPSLGSIHYRDIYVKKEACEPPPPGQDHK